MASRSAPRPWRSAHPESTVSTALCTNVLVPLDVGRPNPQVLAMARTLAEQSGALITVLHVIQRIDGLTAAETRRFYDRLARTARRKMEAVARRLTSPKVDARALVVIGDPPQEIVRQVATGGADMIVMNSHRVEPGGRGRGLGTTSYKVALLCPCPVLLVK
jgi:nucleotide-binding universal stress UspA family protein